MRLTRRIDVLCTGQLIWVRIPWMESKMQIIWTDEAPSLSLTRVDFFLGEPNFLSNLGSNWIKIQSLLLARIEHSSWAVAWSGIYLSHKEQERWIMAWTSLNVFQSGLESCTNCAYVNFLWQQNKVFKKEDWLAKQGCKFHLSFYL